MPRGFRDLRTVAELLSSPRWPKEVKFTFISPLSKGLRGFLGKIQTLTTGAVTATGTAGSVAGTGSLTPVGSATLRGAVVAGAALAVKAFKKTITGKGGAVVSSTKATFSTSSVGAQIIEETDPNKIRNPVVEGPSVSAAQLGKSIAETAGKSLVTSLVVGVPVATGLLPEKKIFSTLQSLKNSPRYFDVARAKLTVSPELSPTTELDQIVTPTKMLYPQYGLLEDEIMYRLVLIAENVYYPANEYAISRYGQLRILEGFRGQNSGKSRHERGEALDLTLGDGSLSHGQNLYELAVWMRDHMLYDQLILCFSLIGDGQVWIHVSFTPTGRRRQVLTKTANDIFLTGLHLHGAYTDATLYGQHLAEARENRQLVQDFASELNARETRLNPIDINTPRQVSGIGLDASQTKCLIDPFGQPYKPDNSKQTEIMSIVSELLGQPSFLAMAQSYDRVDMVPFAREVASRAGVGMNAVRGNAGDPSGDAIAILNPTGAKGFGSWDADKRVQIMDIVGGAHGGPDSTPTASWIDQTNLCPDDTGGGFIVP